jgi:hypothetical protein
MANQKVNEAIQTLGRKSVREGVEAVEALVALNCPARVIQEEKNIVLKELSSLKRKKEAIAIITEYVTNLA